MTHAELQAFYEKRRSHFADALQKIKREINFVSNVRLGVAALFLICLYLAFDNNYLFYVLPALLVGFVILIRKHAGLFQKKTHLENLVDIHWNELQALEGNFSCFESGEEFIEPHHPFTHDLDVFGKG